MLITSRAARGVLPVLAFGGLPQLVIAKAGAASGNTAP